MAPAIPPTLWATLLDTVAPVVRAIGLPPSAELNAFFLAGCGISVVICLAVLLLKPKNKRGYGSGENNRWNRRIRTERPKHQSKHHQLEHAWEYVGEFHIARL
jgi:hypothetical protein